MNSKTFEENFKNDKGTSRLISNLVFTTIRNFNFNPESYNIPDNQFFQKITIKGSKAYELMLENPTEDSLDVDADLFLNKDIIKNFASEGVGALQAIPKINDKIDSCETSLEYLAKKFETEFNKKVNFSDIDRDNYTNMIYIVQLDAIVNKYITLCKNAYLIPYVEDKKRCYNCKVVHTVKQIQIDINNKQKSVKKMWLLKFAFQFDFKETFIERSWAEKGLIIPFFDLTVANSYLQIENYNGKLDVEISPKLFVIRPNLILDNLIDMASQPSFFKKDKAKAKYDKLIHLPFNKYSCSIIDKISPQKDGNNSVIRKRQLIKNNPTALARSNEELYKQRFGESMQKELDNFILDTLEGNNANNKKKKILEKLTPQQKQEYKRQFIQQKLRNIGAIGNLNKHIYTNASRIKTSFSDILEPFKDFVDVFYNAHDDYVAEYKGAKEKCSKYLDLQKEFTLSNVSYSKNNTNKLSAGILTKYKKDTTSDNFFPMMFYNIYNKAIQMQSLFYGRNTEIWRSPIIKFTSFSYWKFFTNVEPLERIKNSVWPKPVCLDELEEASKYFINMNIPDIVDTKSRVISRNFLSQRGFLIVIYPLTYLKKTTNNGKQVMQPLKPNVRNIELEIGNKKEKKSYKFYNSQVKFIKKIPSYQKVIIDGKAYLDAINILVFHELPQN